MEPTPSQGCPITRSEVMRMLEQIIIWASVIFMWVEFEVEANPEAATDAHVGRGGSSSSDHHACGMYAKSSAPGPGLSESARAMAILPFRDLIDAEPGTGVAPHTISPHDVLAVSGPLAAPEVKPRVDKAKTQSKSYCAGKAKSKAGRLQLQQNSSCRIGKYG